MKTHPLIILTLAVLMMGGAVGFLYHVRQNQNLGKPGVKIVAEPIKDSHGKVLATNSIYLPERVLNYTSEVPPIDDVVLSWLPADTTYGQRLYQAPDGFRVQISVVLMGTDRTSIHKPQYCLPAQGWTIASTELTNIHITQPHSYLLPITKITAHQEVKTPAGQPVTRGALNVYWFVAENKVTARHEDWMWSMMKHLVTTGELQRWAYVSCFTACMPGQEQAAYARLQEVLSAAVPQFQLVSGPPLKLASTQN